MAVVTHPDGYLQITEGHNWQDISDNGILQRIFKGWNERRLVAGLPLYWYGKNPNASILLGGDAQFTEFENPLTIPNPTYTLEDARIYPGANLQNVAFWNFLTDKIQELKNPFPPVQSGAFWYKYEYNGEYQGNEYSVIDWNEVDDTIGDNVSVGDILAINQINKILHVLWYLQFFNPNPSFGIQIAPNEIYPLPKYNASSGNGFQESCQAAYSEAISLWYSNMFQQGVFGYIFTGEAEGRQSTSSDYFYFQHRSSFTAVPYTQPEIPINGEFILIANSVKPNSTYAYSDLTSIMPTLGAWTVGRYSLSDSFTLQTDHFGFDITNPPLELFGVNCSNLTEKTFGFWIALFLKPQFADLAPYVPNAYNYSVNVTRIDPPQTIDTVL